MAVTGRWEGAVKGKQWGGRGPRTPVQPLDLYSATALQPRTRAARSVAASSASQSLPKSSTQRSSGRAPRPRARHSARVPGVCVCACGRGVVPGEVETGKGVHGEAGRGGWRVPAALMWHAPRSRLSSKEAAPCASTWHQYAHAWAAEAKGLKGSRIKGQPRGSPRHRRAGPAPRHPLRRPTWPDVARINNGSPNRAVPPNY